MTELQIREINYEKDINVIIDLIRKNLNENFSRDFFLWKHFYNPYGKSYGLLGLHNGKIIGLRMFMFWEFYDSKNDRIIRAIRPVDTFTDLNYRGKGVFKKLTLEGLSNCKDSYDIVFNTPNENSLPGNLRMGWRKISNTGKFKIGILNPFSKFISLKRNKINDIKFNNYSDHDYIETNKTSQFIKWRYSDNQYNSITYKNTTVIYTINKLKGFKSIIINDIIGDINLLNVIINSIARKHATLIIYFYENYKLSKLDFLWKISKKKSIIVYKDDLYDFRKKLVFSLGDLESKL